MKQRIVFKIVLYSIRIKNVVLFPGILVMWCKFILCMPAMYNGCISPCTQVYWACHLTKISEISYNIKLSTGDLSWNNRVRLIINHDKPILCSNAKTCNTCIVYYFLMHVNTPVNMHDASRIFIWGGYNVPSDTFKNVNTFPSNNTNTV